MILHYHHKTESVTDENGKTIPISYAKIHWESGKVTDCSAGFKRLADSNFDMEAFNEETRLLEELEAIGA